jgi:hypothetical protein
MRVVGAAGDVAHFFLVAGLEAHVIDHVERARQEVDDGVQQRLHTLVLERGAAENRHEGQAQRALADQLAQGRDVGLLAFEVGLHRVVVLLDGVLDHVRAPLVGEVLKLVADRLANPGGAQVFALPDPLFHGDQVDDALELVLGPDREVHRNRRRAGAVLDHLHAVEEVGADLVHLVDEDHPRNLVAVGLTPHRFGLRLDTGVGVESAIAPSSTASERSTSMVKSTWPGVSMMLKRCFGVSASVPVFEVRSQKVVVAADVIVMPRSCSCSIQSIVAAPSWTSPILWDLPV